MSNLFNYVFYRIAKFYYKWDGSDSSTAIIAISGIQVLYVALLFSTLIRVNFTRHQINPYSKSIEIVGFFSILILVYLNSKKYEGLYNLLRNKWINETYTQGFFRGLGVWVIALFPLLGMLFLAII
ncbi:hypothetical protein [Hymenobacter psoromatis]|uniref:hypothetical protein n=1 Tax=Hymenobacter psoromatis TaxID=1484116 RepID=UPI001CBCC822|nr:hypothetical protein [Hymenobacter psoromatis]